MKNVHIHKNTFFIPFLYEGEEVFAIIDNIFFDHEVVEITNSYGIPTEITRKELLEILREDASTDIKQYTYDEYLALEDAPFIC